MKARLGREKIVEAALELLDSEGLAAVSTRRLAARLGIKSSSLYWHVRNRDELLDLLADRIVAGARWPTPSAEWRDQVERLMREYLRLLLAHRDGPRVLAGRQPTGPNRLRGAELLLNALVRAGLTEREAVDGGLILTTYVVGYALEHQAAAAFRAVGSDPLPLESYPTLSRLTPFYRPGAAAKQFGQGLALILDGVQARAATHKVDHLVAQPHRPRRSGPTEIRQ